MIRKKKTAVTGPTIYIGPTMDSWPLKQYTSFIDGVLPESVAQKMAEHPELKSFIVQPTEIAEIERKIADKTSVHALQFAKIKTLNKG